MASAPGRTGGKGWRNTASRREALPIYLLLQTMEPGPNKISSDSEHGGGYKGDFQPHLLQSLPTQPHRASSGPPFKQRGESGAGFSPPIGAGGRRRSLFGHLCFCRCSRVLFGCRRLCGFVVRHCTGILYRCSKNECSELLKLPAVWYQTVIWRHSFTTITAAPKVKAYPQRHLLFARCRGLSDPP
jgi:hypothetical protein